MPYSNTKVTNLMIVEVTDEVTLPNGIIKHICHTSPHGIVPINVDNEDYESTQD